ncbi:hypothetical protein [Secundilactobacillus silagei]|uniref:hypothetical protein n=1 Tax=Secundilactobacillus silagei TaxID=1293415 RepID=UPI0006D09478|nr:hypothetical protein [Secundilactobacillus silagei]
MDFLGKTVVLGLSITCLGVVGNSQTAKASTVKVIQYKNLKAAQYKVVKDAKGYLYKTATLKTKVHSIKSYSKTKFAVSKEAIVRQHNGKKAVYYQVKSSKVSGWFWHGYLVKVASKKPTMTQTAAQQQQITNLQQQISDLKQQLSDLKTQNSNSTTTTPVSTSTDVSAQIASLQNQLNTLKSVGTASVSKSTTMGSTGDDTTNPDDIAKMATTDDVFNGTPTEYYVENGDTIYLYPDNHGDGYPTIIGNNDGLHSSDYLKTLQTYSETSTNNYGTFWLTGGYVPVEYKGQKGYVDPGHISIVPVNKPFYQLGNRPDDAGYGNVAPTDTKVKFTNSLVDGATWTQYSKDVKKW